MNCVHVVPAVAEEASGTSYAVMRMCEALVDQGEHVTLATLDPASSKFPSFLKVFPPGCGPVRLGRSPALLSWLSRQASSMTASVLHNHGLWMMPNVYAGWVARKHNVPLIVSPHGTLSPQARKSGSMVKHVFWPLVQQPALKSTRCFHATAESELESIRDAGFRQPVAVIPNGIDIPPLLSKGPRELRTLLFLGRIHPQKGLDLLLNAWQAVERRFPGWRLRIIGPDNRGYLEHIKRLAAELKVKRVEFPGARYSVQKLLAYRDADLFVLPTHSENFGIAVAESLAAGTPAIVTKGAPWGDLKKHRAGWWIDVGVDSLVSCLEEALHCSTEELEQMGLRGRAWMKEEFAWEGVARKMSKTYAWVLEKTEKPDWVRIQ